MVVFKYPTLKNYDVTKSLEKFKTEDVFDLIYSCVDHVYEGEKIYPADIHQMKRKNF